MSDFIVAGAWHGGLCAAMHLAKAGHRVTVFERQRETDLGYDWTDVVYADALEKGGFPPLPEGSWITAYQPTLIGPGKRFPLRPKEQYVTRDEIHAERKALLAVLLQGCRAAGVELVFEAEVLGPVIESDRVSGLRVRMGDEEQARPADMVLDAAGVDSPVRLNLPARMGIPGALPREDLFYAWRGYFDRLPGPTPQGVYNTYLTHQGRKGLSWVTTNPDSMDILVGNMGRPLDEAELAAAIDDLRADNPLVGQRLLRGGGAFVPIPVRRPLGMLVANGYAAVGDSACMADPFSGSGIGPAIKQGKLLAEVLLKIHPTPGLGGYSLPGLWEYQYRTITELNAASRAATEVMRCVMMTLRPAEMDLMFQRGLIKLRDGVKKPKDALVMLRGLDHPALLWKLVKIPVRGKAVRAIAGRIPKDYDPAAVAAWVKDYEGCKLF